VGQTWTLPVPCRNVPVTGAQMAALAEGFGEAHNRQYGYRSDNEPLQFVALKVIGRGLSTTPRVPDRVARVREDIAERSERKAYFGPDHGWLATTISPRVDLGEKAVDGPMIVEEYDTTTLVPPGWRAKLDDWNNILVERA
jgi:N-methylhydantoinase A